MSIWHLIWLSIWDLIWHSVWHVCCHFIIQTTFHLAFYLGVSRNRHAAYPNSWMVYEGTSQDGGWFGGTPISGNHRGPGPESLCFGCLVNISRPLLGRWGTTENHCGSCFLCKILTWFSRWLGWCMNFCWKRNHWCSLFQIYVWQLHHD